MALEQQRNIAIRHTERLSNLSAVKKSFVRLFVCSRQGFNLDTGPGQRDNTRQSNFVEAMIEAYYPDPFPTDVRWDPVHGVELNSYSCTAAHLYPWSQVDSMEENFGKGARDEIFSPKNGIFLHKAIEKAMDMGLITIVPDMELEPENPASPWEDHPQRQNRLREWEAKHIKEYKVIVLDQNHRSIYTPVSLAPERNIYNLADLHNRKLEFQPDFRPRARYLWWGFLYGILRLGWKNKRDPNNAITREVNKCTRYWGTRGRYVKRSMLLGLIHEIGHDADGILENSINSDDGEAAGSGGDGSGTQEPNMEAVAVMADEAIHYVEKLNADEDEPIYDSDDYDCGRSTNQNHLLAELRNKINHVAAFSL
ncbi:hypothetical protein BX600DRAFT_504485 [Xylariales sp. PMI_506]|nr:hypothetical protein BX600DRAFT_504485 [Xylariales sp. PMI_506]